MLEAGMVPQYYTLPEPYTPLVNQTPTSLSCKQLCSATYKRLEMPKTLLWVTPWGLSQSHLHSAGQPRAVIQAKHRQGWPQLVLIPKRAEGSQPSPPAQGCAWEMGICPVPPKHITRLSPTPRAASCGTKTAQPLPPAAGRSLGSRTVQHSQRRSSLLRPRWQSSCPSAGTAIPSEHVKNSPSHGARTNYCE